MNQKEMLGELQSAQVFFLNSIDCLEESDGNFRPNPECLTATEQVAHTAQTIEWFVGGAESDSGFRMDFAALEAEIKAPMTLAEAKAWLGRAFDRARQSVTEHDMAFWESLLPEGPIMPNHPRRKIIGGITDHTAHHRGALTVYGRLCGRVPAMPYGA